jgi:hypothetical protein
MSIIIMCLINNDLNKLEDSFKRINVKYVDIVDRLTNIEIRLEGIDGEEKIKVDRKYNIYGGANLILSEDYINYLFTVQFLIKKEDK